MSLKQIFLVTCSLTYSLIAGNVSITKHEPVSDNDLECIAYINNTIYLGGDDEQLYSSDDMGKTWNEEEMKRVNGSIDEIIQSSDGTVFIAGGTWDEHFILVSNDKCKSWDRVWNDDDIAIETLVELKNGTILGIGDEDEYVLSNMDYSNWKEFDRPWKKTDKDYKETDVHDSYRFKNGDILLVGKSGFSMCFDKMMENQKFCSMKYNESINFTKLYFLNDNDGFIGSEQGVLYTTKDKGNTWTPVYKGNVHISSIAFNDLGMGVAVGHEGLLLTSSDNGANWSVSDGKITENLNFVQYLEDKRFYAVGDEGVRISITLE